MTTSRSSEAVRLKPGRPRQPHTLAESLGTYLTSLSLELGANREEELIWPCVKYQQDPVGFARDILGVEPCPAQIRILEAVRDHKRVAVASGHRIGKALALDTPIPTKTGWTTMGEIQEGEIVFDEWGEECRVVGTSPIMHGHRCYDVIFSDGTIITADAEHEWLTSTAAARRSAVRAARPEAYPEVVTTEQIAKSIQSRNRGKNHTVQVCGALECDPADLPIDPYLLGVWLGDGHSTCGKVTTADPEIEQAFQDAGWVTDKHDTMGRQGKAWTFLVTDADGAISRPGDGIHNDSPEHAFRRQLRKLKLINNKHIPSKYLRASIPQRLALLQGLMDTDGCCNPNGSVEFCNTKLLLAEGVYELICSLGFKTTLKTGRAKLYGKDVGPKYRIHFTPHTPVFRLARKLARQHTGKARDKWVEQRQIVEVRERESVPVRCIRVDSFSHLFLCSKSFIPTHNSSAVAMLALWFYCSFQGARVVLSSVTSKQVDGVLWREIRRLWLGAKYPIDGDIHELARSGLKAGDLREIVGYTSREAEGFQGFAGPNMLFILDEASGISDAIFEALKGNLAGGGRVILIGNPTKTEGEFFEAFYDVKKKPMYHSFQLSSEDSPNVLEGREVVPGLATREWIEDCRREWGIDHPLYKIRVLGQFVLNEEGRVLSIHDIEQAEVRWANASEEGELRIGLDPAGPGDGGDDTAIAVRRGQKILQLYAEAGLNEDAIVVKVQGVIHDWRQGKERVTVIIDREGPIGATIYGRLRVLASSLPEQDKFHVVGVRSSEKQGLRQPDVYDRIRDELWANLAAWIKAGGGIPSDPKLPKELHCASWRQIVTGRLKATAKPDMRKELGRSPDRADAVALAVWDSISTYRPSDYTPAQHPAQQGKEWWRERSQQGGSRRSEEWWRR